LIVHRFLFFSRLFFPVVGIFVFWCCLGLLFPPQRADLTPTHPLATIAVCSIQKHKQTPNNDRRLSEELGARRAELEKMATLDRKITEEQTQLEKRMEEMRGEMGSLADSEGLRQRAEEDKRDVRGGFFI
jgi:hypothetical protein